MSAKVTGLALELLKEPTDRDKQVKIGASQFSSPCTYCVAEALITSYNAIHGDEREETSSNTYWLGAVIGTAIHAYLESREKGNDNYLIETKVVIGELEDYGVIKSTLDLYVKSLNLVVDWKTTTREKLRWLKQVVLLDEEENEPDQLAQARFTMRKYVAQAMIYAWALTKLGYSVDSIALAFICRDGKTDSDVWSHEVPYSTEYAEAVWQRLENIWDYVKNGGQLEDSWRHEMCYTCNNRR